MSATEAPAVYATRDVPTRDAGQIEAAISTTQALNGELETQLDSLFSKLQPVMLPEPPSPGAVLAGMDPQPMACDLGARVREQNARLSNAILRVQHMRDMLDL